LLAVVVYITVEAPWQRVETPVTKAFMLTVGVTVTILDPVVIPHRPEAVAVIVALPLNEALQFIVPVEVLMTPAESGDTEYVTDRLLAAVAV
jgi:hypothetical protein